MEGFIVLTQTRQFRGWINHMVWLFVEIVAIQKAQAAQESAAATQQQQLNQPRETPLDTKALPQGTPQENPKMGDM